jgi:hypothetical protein
MRVHVDERRRCWNNVRSEGPIVAFIGLRWTNVTRPGREHQEQVHSDSKKTLHGDQPVNTIALAMQARTPISLVPKPTPWFKKTRPPVQYQLTNLDRRS